MAVQPWGPQDPYREAWQPASTPHTAMRAAHTDRERTVDVLKAAYVEGRLSAAEYEQRLAAAHSAVTYGDLGRLVADLPAGPMVLPFGAAMPVVPPTFLAPVRRTSGLAVASLVLGLACLPTMGMAGLPAVITGHLARAQVRRTGDEGAGMATAGLVLGWLSVGGWSLLLFVSMLLAAV